MKPSQNARELRIGTSGYQYDHWVGVLYEEGRPRHTWFDTYAEVFDTVEINNTFYQLPSAKTFDAWHDAAPPGFRYALKFSQYGTHMKKLKDPEQIVSTFLKRAERLKSFLGPILVQLPPHWRIDLDRLEMFLQHAPKRHRWAVEFRDPTWLSEDTFELLQRHGAALCIHDLLNPHPWRATADWVYVRFHGDGHGEPYSDAALQAAADRIGDHLRQNRDVYVYFNNDVDGNAVRNAHRLRDILQS